MSLSYLPLDFFGPGSVVSTEEVVFRGVPLAGTDTARADTIVARLQQGLGSCGSQATIDLQIVALSLQGTTLIDVDLPTGRSSYQVRACLSSNPGPAGQPIGGLAPFWWTPPLA